jgi:hypothetical protein
MGVDKWTRASERIGKGTASAVPLELLLGGAALQRCVNDHTAEWGFSP